jgi:hypothetical protein
MAASLSVWPLCYGPVESANSPGPTTFTETFRFGKRQVESWSCSPPYFVQGILNGDPIGFPPKAYRCIADALDARNGSKRPQAKGAFSEEPGPFVSRFVRHRGSALGAIELAENVEMAISREPQVCACFR